MSAACIPIEAVRFLTTIPTSARSCIPPAANAILSLHPQDRQRGGTDGAYKTATTPSQLLSPAAHGVRTSNERRVHPVQRHSNIAPYPASPHSPHLPRKVGSAPRPASTACALCAGTEGYLRLHAAAILCEKITSIKTRGRQQSGGRLYLRDPHWQPQIFSVRTLPRRAS